MMVPSILLSPIELMAPGEPLSTRTDEARRSASSHVHTRRYSTVSAGSSVPDAIPGRTAAVCVRHAFADRHAFAETSQAARRVVQDHSDGVSQGPQQGA